MRPLTCGGTLSDRLREACEYAAARRQVIASMAGGALRELERVGEATGPWEERVGDEMERMRVVLELCTRPVVEQKKRRDQIGLEMEQTDRLVERLEKIAAKREALAQERAVA